VQWTEDGALLDDLNNLVVDEARLSDLHAAMEYAVTDSLDLVDRLDDTILLRQQLLEDETYGSGMLGHVVLQDDFLAIGSSEFEERIGQANLLDTALSDDGLAVE